MPIRSLLAGLCLLLAIGGGARAQGVLNVGLAGDPGPLDPALSFSFLDRNVYAALCDKLIDTDPSLNYVPQLATAWEWSGDGLALTLHLRDGVVFQDGTRFDAEAVRVNIERDKTLPRSLRKAELGPVASVEVVDPLTVRLHLSTPYAPLLAVLADRGGMMMSPAAIAKAGEDVALHPVCAGPFSFTERVAQDRIVLDRFPGYWNAAAIHLDRIVFRPIPDSTVRLVGLQAGQLQVIDQLAPTDVAAVQADKRLAVAQHVAAAYRTIQFNVAHGPRAKGVLGQNALVRAALDRAIDRDALNQVVFNGLFVPDNQSEAPGSRYYDPAHPVQPADAAAARALLKQAGVDRVAFTLLLGQGPIDGQIGQVIQSMGKDAGFDISLLQLESNAGNQATRAGDFDAALLTWSGRADPDANLSIWLACNGPFNYGQYCSQEMDGLLAQGRMLTDPARRQDVYRRVVDLYRKDLPQVMLYHYTWIWGVSAKLTGFVPNEDGLIRPQGLALAP